MCKFVCLLIRSIDLAGSVQSSRFGTSWLPLAKLKANGGAKPEIAMMRTRPREARLINLSEFASRVAPTKSPSEECHY